MCIRRREREKDIYIYIERERGRERETEKADEIKKDEGKGGEPRDMRQRPLKELYLQTIDYQGVPIGRPLVDKSDLLHNVAAAETLVSSRSFVH